MIMTRDNLIFLTPIRDRRGLVACMAVGPLGRRPRPVNRDKSGEGWRAGLKKEMRQFR